MAHELHEDKEDLSEKTLDLRRAIDSLIEELEAVEWYQERFDATEDNELKDILAHNRDEEKEHAAMVIEWLRREDEVFKEEMEDYLFTENKIAELEEEIKE